jgi:hypothetical protein
VNEELAMTIVWHAAQFPWFIALSSTMAKACEKKCKEDKKLTHASSSVLPKSSSRAKPKPKQNAVDVDDVPVANPNASHSIKTIYALQIMSIQYHITIPDPPVSSF